MKSRSIASMLVVSVCGAAFAQENPPVTKEQSQAGRNAQGAHNDFAQATRWQKSTELIGKKVVNASSENLGKIEEIVVDAESGRILYGVLSFGGVFGIGDKLFAIPWSALALTSDNKEFLLNVDKDRLKNAEGFDKSQWPNFANERWAMTTAEYYGQKPYWTENDSADKKASYQERWYTRATIWQKCSDLCGKDIRTPNNEDLGSMTECVIDPDAGRLLYGIVAHSSKLVAVPWHALHLRDDAKYFVLNTTVEQLRNAPGFTKDTYPNLLDSRWATDTHAYFKIQPYWMDSDSDRRSANP